MFIRFIIIAGFCATHIYGAEFFISEIYARHTGRDHKGKQWLELTIKDEPIKIKKLHLQIFDKSDTALFSHVATFNRPLIFKSHLLIAAKRDLGLPYCLNHDAVAIAQSLHFDLHKAKRICVTINDVQDCTLVNLANIKPGVSIYHDDKTSPVWRNEPCHLVDTIFATPGKPPRSCGPSPATGEKIIEECPYQPSFGKALKFEKIMPRNNHSPQITQARLMRDEKGAHIIASFTDVDNGPWVLTVCHAHRDTNKICHVMGSRHQVFPNVENVVPLTQETIPLHHYVSIEIADITGGLARTIVAHADSKDPLFTSKEWQPIIKRNQTHETAELVFSLRDHELPLNVLLETRFGKFYQTPFLHSGEHRIAIPNAMQKNSIIATLWGPRGTIRLTIF